MVTALPQAVGLVPDKSMDHMHGKKMLRLHGILLASNCFDVIMRQQFISIIRLSFYMQK